MHDCYVHTTKAVHKNHCQQRFVCCRWNGAGAGEAASLHFLAVSGVRGTVVYAVRFYCRTRLLGDETLNVHKTDLGDERQPLTLSIRNGC